MNELDGLLTEPALSDDRIERIRRRGRHVLSHPGASAARPEEVLIVTVFSVAMLLWAVASVLVPTV
jgi:hypothetical protein